VIEEHHSHTKLIRAVHGNYVFVWSGFLEAAENDDEIAALMACEIAHVLAGHTYPVQFTLWTDIFFDVAEMATSLAIMSASQGMVAIGGRGWMKWAYVAMADLDALDREYSSQEERLVSYNFLACPTQSSRMMRSENEPNVSPSCSITSGARAATCRNV
jgi:hypothetical protein